MSPSIKQKKAIPVFLVALVLACFAISRGAQAAQPPDIQNVNQFNTPFQRSLTIRMDPGLTGASDSVDIPAGKTLVVEFVSAIVSLPAGEQLIRLVLTSAGLGSADRADLLWNLRASETDRDIFVVSQQIRLYAKDSLSVIVDRDVGAGWGVMHASVIGYLVNTPQFASAICTVVWPELEWIGATSQLGRRREPRRSVSAVDRDGRTIWIVDAHRDDGRRFVVRSDEKLTAFMELESAVKLD